MGTKGAVLVALVISAAAFAGNTATAGLTVDSPSPEEIRVRAPVIDRMLPSLEEGFAYVELRVPKVRRDERDPPVVNRVDDPVVKRLPPLEEGPAALIQPIIRLGTGPRFRVGPPPTRIA